MTTLSEGRVGSAPGHGGPALHSGPVLSASADLRIQLFVRGRSNPIVIPPRDPMTVIVQMFG